MALAAAGIGKGDEVIVPEVTWIASAAPINYVGATPVFADVEENWCLSVESLEANFTSATRAVIAVDLYGDMPDMPAIRDFCNCHNLLLIEDAAQAIGSTWGSQRAGTFGHVGVFSFHGSKTMTTGEGGMLITDDQQLHERIQMLSDHGRRPGDKSFVNEEVAFKYRMSNLQAAFGLGQLERLDELVRKKRQIHSWYSAHLNEVADRFRLSESSNEVCSSHWMVSVTDAQQGRSKHEWIEALRKLDVDCRPVFSPLSSLPAYNQRHCAERNPVAYRSTQSAINLPSALSLTESDVSLVCSAIKRAM